MEPRPEPSEQPLLSGIAERIPRCERSEAELEADGGRDASQQTKIGLTDVAGLETRDGRAVATGSPGDRIAAQPRGSSRRAHVAPNPIEVQVEAFCRPVGGPGSWCHFAEASIGWLTSRSSGPDADGAPGAPTDARLRGTATIPTCLRAVGRCLTRPARQEAAGRAFRRQLTR